MIGNEELTTRVMSWVVAVMMALGFVACVTVGANSPKDPHLQPARVAGFGDVSFRVVPGAPPTTVARRGRPAPPTTQLTTGEWCALLAASEAQRVRGLMGVTDLKGYAGMVFRFSVDTSEDFWMKDTPMPLSIAFFAADGRFVSSADMDPCINKPDVQCPKTVAPSPYRYAIEVPKGQLGTYGIGPGSVLVLQGGCP